MSLADPLAASLYLAARASSGLEGRGEAGRAGVLSYLLYARSVALTTYPPLHPGAQGRLETQCGWLGPATALP